MEGGGLKNLVSQDLSLRPKAQSPKLKAQSLEPRVQSPEPRACSYSCGGRGTLVCAGAKGSFVVSRSMFRS